MTLLEAKIGSVYELESIELEPAVQRRMEMLGMTHRAKIQVMNRKKNGSIKRETLSWKWTIGAMVMQLGAAWAASAIFFQIAGRIAGVL